MSATLTDKLLLLPALATILGKTVAGATTGLVFGANDTPSLGDHINNTFTRALLTHLSVAQLQYVIPPFTDSYKSWCAKNTQVADISNIVSASGNVSGFWIGNKDTATYRMVYYHGGGFVIPGHTGHLDMLAKFVRWSSNRLAIFCVAYTLSPTAQYPQALGQCVEGLRFVLDQPGCTPERVLLGGDSAGGSLVLGVLGHILHPHPDRTLVKPLNLSRPLFGAVLVSPWISDDNIKYKSVDRLANRDIFPSAVIKYWTSLYKGPGNQVLDDGYIWPAHAAASWWEESPCDNMLATVGGDEALFDSVIDWAQKYRGGAGQAKLELAVGKKEIHIHTISYPKSDEKLSSASDETQEGAIMRWIKTRLT